VVSPAAIPSPGASQSGISLIRRRRQPGASQNGCTRVTFQSAFRLARVRDERGYAETYGALGPLIDVARETGTHVMLLHHSGKGQRGDAIDAPLGSTAIGGAVCTLVVLKREDNYRTIQTVQRVPTDLPETVLMFDGESKRVSLGAEKLEADIRVIEDGIMDYLQSARDMRTESEITEHVEGKTGPKRKALRSLVEQGKVTRNGTGKRGDPFTYKFSFPCSQHIEEGDAASKSTVFFTAPHNSRTKKGSDCRLSCKTSLWSTRGCDRTASNIDAHPVSSEWLA
jgi:hypothetical protein